MNGSTHEAWNQCPQKTRTRLPFGGDGSPAGGTMRRSQSAHVSMGIRYAHSFAMNRMTSAALFCGCCVLAAAATASAFALACSSYKQMPVI